MKQLLRENRYFFIPYAAYVLICTALLLLFSKPELHILINKAHSSFFDFFFKYGTSLGDGMMYVLLLLFLLFVRYRLVIIFVAGSLMSNIVVLLFKKLLLDNVYRPSKYFELFENYQLHLVDGVKLHSLQSFPSGHTTTAFNLFFMLALIVKNNTLKFLFFLIAIITAYSRVYLSQHFLIDTTVGSVIGVGFILIAGWWFGKSNKSWMEKSLLTLRKNRNDK